MESVLAIKEIYLWIDWFDLLAVQGTQVTPEAEPEPTLVQLFMESLLMHHLEDGKGFALLFMTVFPGPGTAPGI